MTTRPWGVTVLAFAVTLTACGGDETGPGDDGETIAISGALAATDGRTGLIALESPAAAAVAASPFVASAAGVAAPAAVIELTGTVALSDGTTAALTGTWDTETGAFSVSGGGFAFTGVVGDGTLTGGFTGPDIEGVFSIQVGAPADLAVYCGTFNGRQLELLPDGGNGTAPSNGTWNLVVGASTIQLIGSAGEDGEPIVAAGTRSGATVTIGGGAGGYATGTIGGAAGEFVSGSYNVSVEDVGTFHGSKAACTATDETGPIASLVLNPPGLLPGDGRLAFDSTLAFVTALDAAGNYVAAPDLVWTFPEDAFLRTNDEFTLPGQQWVVLGAPPGPGTGDPPQLVTRTFTVASRNRPGVTATGTVVVYWYW